MRLLLLIVALLVCVSAGDAADLPDPLPLRRVVVPADRLEAELKLAGDGVRVRMPRKEFEKLVQDAARAVASRTARPKLIEARYRAILTDAPALAGSLQWKLRNPGKGAALLRLGADSTSFNLALRTPRFENRDAILAEFPFPGGSAPALLVDQAGEHTLTAEWTCRAEARPDGIHAELRLPPCPVAAVELDLPAEYVLSGPEGVLIAGPLQAERADRRAWRVAAAGRTVLALVVRRPGSGKPVVFSRQKTVHRLTPDGLEATHSITAESLHGDVRELVFAHDPALRPLDVTGADVERWESRRGSPPQVAVRLRRAVRSVSLEIKGLAPLCGTRPAERGKPCRWISPWIRLRDAVPRGEQLEIWLHPQLEAGAWNAGDFLLVGSSVHPGKPAMRRLVLRGSGISSGKGGPRRPSLSLQTGGVSFHAVQHSEWRLAGDGMEFSSRITYRVRQGLLFQMAASLPAGWEADAVDTVPPGLLRSWSVRGGKSLVAELRRPLTAGGEDASLVIRLRPTKVGPVTGRGLPFPDAVPLGARHREGGLAIDWDEQAFKGKPRTQSLPGDAPADTPGVSPLADLYYPFQGRAPTGVLRLIPRSPRLRARVEVDVAVSGRRASQEIRLVLEAEGGRPGSVEFRLGGPPLEWRTESGSPPRSIERRPERDLARTLAVLGATSPLSAVALALARPQGGTYLITFAHPLDPGKPLVLRASRKLESVGHVDRPRWIVPLPEVAASRMEGDVAVSLAGGAQASADVVGLRNDLHPRRPAAWRNWRYGAGATFLELRVRGTRVGPASEARASAARIVTALSPEGVLRHSFSFDLRGWPGRTLPLQLPPGTRLVSASADGRWLQARVNDEGEIRVPVPVGGARLEIRYESDPGSGPFLRLEAPVPALPVAPVSLSRHWLLPPGMRPLLDSAVASLPGTTGVGAGNRMRYPSDVLRLGPMLPLPGRPAQTHAGRPEALAEAAAGIRNERAGQETTLAGLVEELAFVYLRGAHPLVVDAAEAKTVGGKFRLTSTGFPWQAAGLEAIPARTGVLLTSKRQAEAWGGALPAEVEEAVGRAVASGCDPSGRFASALEWLSGAAPPVAYDVAEERLREGWSAWEPLAGTRDEDTLSVVHSGNVTAAGAALAVLLLAGLVALRKSTGGARLRWLAGFTAVAGLALAWLPSSLLDLARWPLIAGLALALPVVLNLGGARRTAPTTVGRARVATGSAVVGLLLLVCFLHAQPRLDTVVFLLGEGDKQAVLLPLSLQKKLEVMAKAEGVPGGAVLASATYAGRVAGGVAEFDATFLLHALQDGRSMAEIPLDGVQLVGDVLLDGAKVLPRALAAPRAGYAVPISGKGTHKAQMRFRVAATIDAGGLGIVKLSLPRLVQSRLSFLGPAGAKRLDAPGRQGAQSQKDEKGKPRLEADLGALAGPLVVRWQKEGKAPQPARAVFREAHVWDLRPEGASLTSFLRYSLTGGTTSLTMDIPAQLVVRAALARRSRPVAGEPVARLSGWSVSPRPGGEVLKLDFPGPMSGEVEVEVELAPRGPLVGTALLPLPRPHGKPGAGLGQVAYRAPGLDANRSGLVGLTGIPTEKFAADWPAAIRPPANGLSYAGTFRSGEPPQLKVEARPRLPSFNAEQRIRYRVGLRQATLQAQVSILPAAGPPAVLEWDLGGSGVQVSSVQGEGLGGWSQTGRSLLVWMDKVPTRLEIAGWVPLDDSTSTKLQLPCLRPTGAAKVKTTIDLEPELGLVVTPQKLANLATAGRPLSYEARNRYHGGVFLVRPSPAPTAQVRTRAEVRGAWLEFEASLDCSLSGEARTLTVHLHGWPGDAELSAPPGMVQHRMETFRRGQGRSERAWRLEPRPGLRRLALTVKGRLPLEEATQGVPMPDLTVGKGEHLLEVGAGLEAVGPAGLASLPRGKWRVRGDDWSLRLLPLASPRGPEPAVLLAQARLSVPDGKRWMHEVTWRLQQEGPAEVRVTLPAGASLVSVDLDGKPAQAAQPERGHFVLSLQSQNPLRLLRVRYRRGEESEPLARPRLAMPRLEGARPGSVLWSVEVPVGWQLAASSSPPLSAALGRAAVELYLNRADPKAGGPLAARRLRLAELALEDAQPLGAAGEALAILLKASGEGRKARLGDTSQASTSGEVRRWLGTEPPTVRLSSLAGRRPEQALGATLQWLVLWVLLWAASLSSRLRTLGRWLWPEAVLAIGLAGWQWHGPTLVAILLVVIAALSRLLLIVAGVRWLLQPARRKG